MGWLICYDKTQGVSLRVVMKNLSKGLIILVIWLFAITVYAESQITKRISQLENDKVKVWKTIIFPAKNQKLIMHRHEFDRVLIALSSGTLKIVNDKGQIHYLKLKKGQSYYLKKDIVNELHSDENLGNQPIKVIVVELKIGS